MKLVARQTMTPEQIAAWQQELHRPEYLCDRIQTLLRERYPDGLLPWGAQKALADELGCSAVYVAQCAAQLRFHSAPPPKADDS